MGAWITVSSCSNKGETPLLELLPSDVTGIDFTNQLYEDEDLNIITFEYFYNGAGVGIGDINNDGLQDIFFLVIWLVIACISIRETCGLKI